MESSVPSILGLDTRIRGLERAQSADHVEIEAVKDDIKQVNLRLDRAARAGYFVGTALMTLSATILGAVLVPH
jgi:hypothetical protein